MLSPDSPQSRVDEIAASPDPMGTYLEGLSAEQQTIAEQLNDLFFSADDGAGMEERSMQSGEAA